jgi:hypothetical protein
MASSAIAAPGPGSRTEGRSRSPAALAVHDISVEFGSAASRGRAKWADGPKSLAPDCFILVCVRLLT